MFGTVGTLGNTSGTVLLAIQAPILPKIVAGFWSVPGIKVLRVGNYRFLCRPLSMVCYDGPQKPRVVWKKQNWHECKPKPLKESVWVVGRLRRCGVGEEKACYRQASTAHRHRTMHSTRSCRKIQPPTRYSTANPKPVTLNPRPLEPVSQHKLYTLQETNALQHRYKTACQALKKPINPINPVKHSKRISCTTPPPLRKALYLYHAPGLSRMPLPLLCAMPCRPAGNPCSGLRV